MPDFKAFFLNGASKDVELETLEISHPSFSKTYYIVRNARLGVTATLETGASVYFEWCPFTARRPGDKDDLDQTYTFGLPDVGTILAEEVARIQASDTFRIKPLCKYRRFLSSDLSAPLYGPEILEIPEITGMTQEGSEFEAKPPSIDLTRTGEIYSLDRFPMLRGVL